MLLGTVRYGLKGSKQNYWVKQVERALFDQESAVLAYLI